MKLETRAWRVTVSPSSQRGTFIRSLRVPHALFKSHWECRHGDVTYEHYSNVRLRQISKSFFQIWSCIVSLNGFRELPKNSENPVFPKSRLILSFGNSFCLALSLRRKLFRLPYLFRHVLEEYGRNGSV